jgi:DNA-binding MarR family transcriptional regulator
MVDSAVPVTEDIYEVAAGLRTSIGMLLRKMKQTRAGSELSMPETAVLSRLDRNGPATSSDLARLDRISPQSMGATVAALEERGLVARTRDPEDGRRIVLSITEQGRQVVRDRRDERTEKIAIALGAGFTEAERAQLRAVAPLLERLAERL